jgi:hypothetical protein
MTRSISTNSTHESTHALIDATNPGLEVSVGLGEAAAYLAEAILAINDGRFGTILDPKLEPVMYFPCVFSGVFVCRGVQNRLLSLTAVRKSLKNQVRSA